MAKTKKPKRGRAFRTGEHTSSMTIRLTDTEREAYEAARLRSFDEDGEPLSLAAWIRQACAEKLKRG